MKMQAYFKRGVRGLAAEAAPFDLDAFCFPQFDDPLHAGTRFHGLVDKETFLQQVHAYVKTEKDTLQLIEGYAPFCCHLFVPNFCGARPTALEITPTNEPLLRSGYLSRRAEELPVLTRWFPEAVVGHLLKPAKYLDIILYSREQIEKEAAAMRQHQQQEQPGKEEENNSTEGDSGGAPSSSSPSSSSSSPSSSTSPPRHRQWSIISIKAQDEPHELPMAPITMMRNALIEEGGSGVPIDRAAYAASVKYWSSHAIIREEEKQEK